MKNNNQEKGDLGQHWTPKETVELMISLIEDFPEKGTIFEPSVGCGNIYRELIKHFDHKTISAIEVDEEVIPQEYKGLFEVCDFFDYEDKVFDCIIGNPPYVNGRLLDKSLKEKIKGLNNDIPITSNLYLHFIEKCVKSHMKEGSQIIFIIPNTFLSKVSFGKKLRKYLLANGNITHYIKHLAKWEKAAVETIIFRWVKGQNQNNYIINEDGEKTNIFYNDGTMFFVDYEPYGTLGEWFDIAVGSAPKSINRSDKGIPLIKNNKIEFYSKEHTWAREKYSKICHKILFNAGPTRSKEIFYNTLDFDEEQASKHIDFSMTFKCKITEKELEYITNELNNFFKEKDNILGLRNYGRWSVGITEMKNIPINKKLKNIFEGIKCLKV